MAAAAAAAAEQAAQARNRHDVIQAGYQAEAVLQALAELEGAVGWEILKREARAEFEAMAAKFARGEVDPVEARRVMSGTQYLQDELLTRIRAKAQDALSAAKELRALESQREAHQKQVIPYDDRH